jgi:dTDP-4-dehydrorhamnose reductase
MATRVLVAGADGMLGRELVGVLEHDRHLEVVTSSRSGEGGRRFDATADPPEELLSAVDCDWAINAIGVLAGRIDASDPVSVTVANQVNGAFPLRLARAAEETGCRLIHVSTDGVFAAEGGPADEGTPPDAGDPYGLSKRHGEPPAPSITLRCSIIGTEEGEPRSLLGWALSRPRGAVIEGHTDRVWNGVTTLALARVCAGIIRENAELPVPVHVVPADVLSKADLLALCLREFGRDDVELRPVESGSPRTRTLATRHPAEHERLWTAAGYDGVPAIAELVAELAARARTG